MNMFLILFLLVAFEYNYIGSILINWPILIGIEADDSSKNVVEINLNNGKKGNKQEVGTSPNRKLLTQGFTYPIREESLEHCDGQMQV